MNEYSQNILLLQVISISFEHLKKSNAASQSAMKTIISMWQSILNDISNVKKALTDVTKDVNVKEDYINAANDLKAANEAWQQVTYIANTLSTINFKWQDKNGNWNNHPEETPSINNSAKITIINK